MHPNPQECEELYHLYKQTFAFDDGGSIDDYFQRNFRPENCFIIKQEEQIIGMLNAHPHTMHIASTTLPVVFISGVIIREAYRRKGYMKALFADLREAMDASTALYVLQAYHPEIYTSLGFVEQYFIQWHSWEEKEVDHLVEIDDPLQLSQTAMVMLQGMQGWLEHDPAFYENQLIEASAVGQQYLGYYKDNQLQAFARGNGQGNRIRLEEIKARSDVAQAHLLSQLRMRYSQVTYPLICDEQATDRECNLMVKLGNASLCSQRLGKKVTSLQDIYKKSQPLLHDGWW